MDGLEVRRPFLPNMDGLEVVNIQKFTDVLEAVGTTSITGSRAGKGDGALVTACLTDMLKGYAKKNPKTFPVHYHVTLEDPGEGNHTGP